MIYPEKKMKRRLVVDLTPDEIEQFGADAAEFQHKAGEWDVKVDATTKLKKEQQNKADTLRADSRYALKCVHSQTETREVDCIEKYDPEDDKMKVWRMDCEPPIVVEQRSPLGSERQGQLVELSDPTTSAEQDVQDSKPAGSTDGKVAVGAEGGLVEPGDVPDGEAD